MHPSSDLAAFMHTMASADRRWRLGSTLITYLADSQDTGGAFCLLEVHALPGSEPPPHVHTREDELFYILEGELHAFVGPDDFEAGAGGCVFLPRFKPHTFIIRSSSLRMLALFTPGGIEEMFRSMSVPDGTAVLPDIALRHPDSSRSDVAPGVSDGGTRFLAPEEIAREMPTYHRIKTGGSSAAIS